MYVHIQYFVFVFVFVFLFVFAHLGAVLVNLGDEVVAHGCLVHPVLLHPKFASVPIIIMMMLMIRAEMAMMMMINDGDDDTAFYPVDIL